MFILLEIIYDQKNLNLNIEEITDKNTFTININLETYQKFMTSKTPLD